MKIFKSFVFALSIFIMGMGMAMPLQANAAQPVNKSTKTTQTTKAKTRKKTVTPRAKALSLCTGDIQHNYLQAVFNEWDWQVKDALEASVSSCDLLVTGGGMHAIAFNDKQWRKAALSQITEILKGNSVAETSNVTPTQASQALKKFLNTIQPFDDNWISKESVQTARWNFNEFNTAIDNWLEIAEDFISTLPNEELRQNANNVLANFLLHLRDEFANID